MALDTTVIPVSFLRSQFDYDPTTGAITNAATRKGAKTGADPSYPFSNGYRGIKVTYEGVRYTFLAHRLAFALKKGRHPKGEVDHRSRVRDQNWFKNLRESTPAQNKANRLLKPGQFPLGVSKTSKPVPKPFVARIAVDGKRLHLGSFDCPKKAGRAYRAAALKHFGAFAVKPQGHQAHV